MGKLKMFNFMFFLNSALLGVGLAMDAFSVSLANGLGEPKMKKARLISIAGVFSFFQFLMPLIGWVCIHTIAQQFIGFQKFIPWIALALLGYIGGSMLIEGIKTCSCPAPRKAVGAVALIMQGVATSIDALSVGFTISDYTFLAAFVCAVIIAVVTFIICVGGLLIGKRFGTCFANKASILGGAILIIIGIEIFIKDII